MSMLRDFFDLDPATRGSSTRRVYLVVFITALAGAIIIPATAVRAGTLNLYQPVLSIDGTGTPAGSVAPRDLAVHQASGTLYVFDNANGGVVKFDALGNPQDFSALGSPVVDASATSTGAFVDLTAIAVDNSGGPYDGSIYVLDRPGGQAAFNIGRLSVFDPAGNLLFETETPNTPTGTFGGPGRLAVDSTGAVYVAGFYANAVRKLTPTGSGVEYESEIPFASPFSTAIDSSDNLYINGLGDKPSQKCPATSVCRFTPAGTLDAEILLSLGNNQIKGLAVNPSTGNFFVGVGDSTHELSPAGDQLFRFGTGSSITGLAVDGSLGRVYVGNTGIVRAYSRKDVTVPDVAIEAASALTSSTATLKGTVDPLGFPSSFHFEYRIEGQSVWTSTPEDSSSGSGIGAKDVSADVGGLKPGTTYEARIVAANTEAGADNGAVSTSAAQTFTTDQSAPVLLTSPAAAATTNSVTLHASLIPGGPGTTYHFEYGTSATYGSAVPVPDGSAGGGPNGFYLPLTVSEQIEGLEPNTTYHFRVVVTNAKGAVEGLDRTFKTLDPNPAAGLPDSRVYERASPLDKNGSNVERTNELTLARRMYQVSTNGNAAVFTAMTSFGGDAASLFNTYLSRRGPDGWTTIGLNPRTEPESALATIYEWFSNDLSLGVVSVATQLHPDDPFIVTPSGQKHNLLYARNTLASNDAQSSAYRLLTPPVSGKTPFEEHPIFLLGASGDLSHRVLNSTLQLTPDGSPDNPSLLSAYEWVNGEIRLVGILPDGTPAATSIIGASPQFKVYPGDNPISQDGSRVFFTANPNPNGGGDLYVRENGSSTTAIGSGRFQGAKASDGSVAFFVSGSDLFRWDANVTPGNQITNLTGAAPGGGGALGTAGISEDATKVYFAATGDLAPGATAGIPNLYLWQLGSGIRHVATLSGETNGVNFVDNPIWGRNLVASYAEANGDKYTGARITPDGERFAFQSKAQLTSFDNKDHTEIYLYDLSNSEITCVSCYGLPGSGSGSKSGSYFSIPFNSPDPSFGYGVSDATMFLPRNLSSDGRRVFFDTEEALLPSDTNGKADVYEWSDAELHLISTGDSGTDSTFMGASDDGNDAFFATGEQLVRSDADSLVDLYDARVGGKAEPASIPGCVADECQGTPSPPPAFDDPGTRGFAGPGSPQVARKERARCAKHRVRRKGRCVKQKKHQRQAAHNNRGGAK